jgi:hypothetical protein
MELSDINLVHAKYPWASEATLEALVRIAGVNNSRLIRIAKRLDIDLNDIDISDNRVAQEEYTSLSMNTVADLSKSLNSTDPVETAMMLFQKTAEFTVAGVKGGTGIIANMFGLWGKKIGEAISGIFAGIGTVFGALKAVSIPVMAYFSNVIKLQQAESEAMIKYGVVVEDIGMFTLFRKSAAGIGLSIEEMIKKIAPAAVSLANMNGGIIKAAGNLAAVISTKLKGEAKKLGYSVGDYTSIIVAQSETMYKLGKIETIDVHSLDRVNKRVTETTQLATQLAGHFGLSREAMLAEMKQSLESISLIAALKRSAKIIADMGPNAENNIKNTATQGIVALSSVIGPDDAPQLKEVMNAMISNFNLDSDADAEFATMAPELMKKYVNAGIWPHIQQFFKDAAAGQGAIENVNNILTALRNDSNLGTDTAKFDAAIKSAPYNALQQSYVDLVTRIHQAKADGRLNNINKFDKKAAAQISSAANILGAMSDMRVSMRKLHQAISPKFEHSERLMAMGQGWLDATEKQLIKMADIYAAFSESAGAPVPHAPTDNFDKLSEFYKNNSGPNPAYDITKYIRPDDHPQKGSTYYKTTKGVDLTDQEMFDNLIHWLSVQAMKASTGKGYEISNPIMKSLSPMLLLWLTDLGLGPDFKEVDSKTEIKDISTLIEILSDRKYGRAAEHIMYDKFPKFREFIENLIETQPTYVPLPTVPTSQPTDVTDAAPTAQLTYDNMLSRIQVANADGRLNNDVTLVAQSANDKIATSMNEIKTDTIAVASIIKNITRINSDLSDINGILNYG